MTAPNLNPVSTISKSILPITGTHSKVNLSSNPLPFGIYMKNDTFISGAVDQVAYTYKKLGGDVLDVELSEHQIYAAYEESVLEYSYLVNIHQAKNSLGSLLGATTASFNEDGQIEAGEALSGSNIELRYPRYTFQYSQRVADGLATEAGIGGDLRVYSASFALTASVQDYDLQTIVKTAENGDFKLNSDDSIGRNKITIRKVYYVTPRAMWRFFAYYGGINTIGNLSSYGQYADDSTFEVVPAWQNKLQAIQYEDSINTRISHYSYELRNNKIRVWPKPTGAETKSLWVHFTVKKDAWDETPDRQKGGKGVNNMNTLPFANIPYSSINSIGKQWIRRFSLALSKEMLGQIRGKFGGSIPIPGETLNLNSADLLSQAKEEQDKLREELKTVLDELTYAKLAETDAATVDNALKVQSTVPVPIFVG